MNMQGQLTAQCNSPGSYSPPPLSVRLQERKKQLESELAKVDKAIELLNATPQMSLLMDVISQLNV